MSGAIDGVEMVDRLAASVLWACDHPELLQAHGLPVPTADRRRRVLRGYVGPHQEFPPRRNSFEPLATLLGLDRVCTERARFRFAEHGELAEILVIQPVPETGRDGDREPADLLCWHPNRPRRWWMLTGTAQHLGPWPDHGEARLVEHPMAWLSDTEALCLLNFDREVLMRLLDLHKIIITDRDFGSQLYSALRELALPQFEIVVP